MSLRLSVLHEDLPDFLQGAGSAFAVQDVELKITDGPHWAVTALRDIAQPARGSLDRAALLEVRTVRQFRMRQARARSRTAVIPGGAVFVRSRSMRERVRNACSMAVIVLVCCGGSLLVATFQVAAEHHPLVAVAVVGGYAVRLADRMICAWLTRHRLEAEGWQPEATDRPWPWLPLSERPDRIRVHRAWTRTVDGLPLTIGEISWDDNALSGSVRGWKGRGVFVVVTLPTPAEPMALRIPHRTIGASHRLDSPAMHAAYAAGEIPPWTADGDLLFTFSAMPGQLRADAVQLAVQRTLLVVDLLDLRCVSSVAQSHSVTTVRDRLEGDRDVRGAATVACSQATAAQVKVPTRTAPAGVARGVLGSMAIQVLAGPSSGSSRRCRHSVR